MRAMAAGMGLGILLAAASAWTQDNPQSQNVSSQPVSSTAAPDYSSIYCSNFVSSERGKDNAYLISGEESSSKLVFALRDLVTIDRGSSQGVRVGDRYSVFRPEKDPLEVQWYKWQDKLRRAMGTFYRDTGQLKVLNVQPNVSVAQVIFACDYLQRGDLIAPFEERPSPPFKPAAAFDIFAPPSGKSVGMLVYGKEFTDLFGKLSTVYVNLGTNQGVHVGDYLRIFRYQGSHAELTPNFDDYQDRMYGFGSTPTHYKWNDLPRDVLGEGIVLNVGPNSATIMLTVARMDAYAGDYVEVE
jgi:hypothetical protein